MEDQIPADIVIKILREEVNQLHWELTLYKAKLLQTQQQLDAISIDDESTNES